MSTAKPRKRMSAAERRTVIETAATEVFASHGYQRASMEEIASRSGVSVPVVYDHFSSKRELHRRLLERHYADLRDLWRSELDTPDPDSAPNPASRTGPGSGPGSGPHSAFSSGPAPAPEGDINAEDVARAFDAWFRYIETHPYAWRMLFSDTTGDPGVREEHETVVTDSRDELLPFFARLVGIPYAPDVPDVPGGSDAPVQGNGGQNAEHREPTGQQARIEAEMAWEVCRSVLQGLAQWWRGCPDVPRERLVAAAMDALWTGLERSRRGERWPVTAG
ncbi:TetR/AcrR family transcriptional regulator [Streptomyces iconiensis]|uniref:TetR/AcrR family transcriptional regulator n=1 Tax=Streptomyces iconiensis TaxID=1384038 RepID=A0ABT6ZPM9_9ACTN|nr:TetR/AcrR family transcriptional regulator [Streptomyces iconiensis]MDJ1131005.1 TetR/AcrR family transcriptional regulator [Streptomyces iconiensis]